MPRIVKLAAAAALAASAYLSSSNVARQGSFELGPVSNADPAAVAPKIARLGVPVVRVEFPIDAAPARLVPVIEAFARRHISVLPLAGFPGRIPTTAQARNLATWARAFGPSGTFWAHRSGAELAIQDIEFGNETNQAYQFGGCDFACAAFTERAHAYALAFKDARKRSTGRWATRGSACWRSAMTAARTRRSG